MSNTETHDPPVYTVKFLKNTYEECVPQFVKLTFHIRGYLFENCGTIVGFLLLYSLISKAVGIYTVPHEQLKSAAPEQMNLCNTPRAAEATPLEQLVDLEKLVFCHFYISSKKMDYSFCSIYIHIYFLGSKLNTKSAAYLIRVRRSSLGYCLAHLGAA
jgi:hypothetical protein